MAVPEFEDYIVIDLDGVICNHPHVASAEADVAM
jgi:hypothetical protein